MTMDDDLDEGSAKPSFVKRSRQRGSGIRPRIGAFDKDTAHDGGSSEAGPSRIAISSSLSSKDAHDAREEDSSNNVVFRARAGVRPSGASTSSKASPMVTPKRSISTATLRKSFASEDDEDPDSGPAFEIRRSKLNNKPQQARIREKQFGSTTSSPSLRKATPLRPSAFKDLHPNAMSLDQADITDSAADATIETPSYTSRLLAELRSSTPSTKSRSSSPSLGPGTRIQETIARHIDPTKDNEQADALTRSKFGQDLDHTAIPSESQIRAAKEKRAKLRAQYLKEQQQQDEGAGEDFISLSASTPNSRSVQKYEEMELDDGPHPHSRLQREEDEFGDGEEEFAEYTGATERIPIGEKAEKEYRERQRQEMEAALNGDLEDAPFGDGDGITNNPAAIEEMDEDEEEWERAQLRRTEMHGYASKQEENRETTPHRSASIPASAPLPTVSSTSARLKLALHALEQSAASHSKVIESTSTTLKELYEAESLNKADVVAMEDKEAWFRELNEFIISLAKFMDEKGPRIDDIEAEVCDLLAERTRMIGKERSKSMEDELSLFWGVPSISIFPSRQKPNAEEEDMLEPEHKEVLSQEDPAQDGPYNSPIREARRNAVNYDQTQTELLHQLSPSDEAAFHLAQAEIAARLQSVFADVQADEYLDPMARLGSGGEGLHPRSVVARFQDWRRRYGEEYAQVWGGLSVAQIWEFYARKDMLLWDVLPTRASSAATKSVASNGSPGQTAVSASRTAQWVNGADQLHSFAWLTGVSAYTEAATEEVHDPSSGLADDHPAVVPGKVIGGDDELLSTIFSNVLIPRIKMLPEKGAFDPWNTQESLHAIRLLEDIKTICDKGDPRIDALVGAFLSTFADQVNQLSRIFSEDPVHPPPNFHPEARTAHVAFLDPILSHLVPNLVLWHKVVRQRASSSSSSSTTSDNKQKYFEILQRLIHDVIIKLVSLPVTQGNEDAVERLVKSKVLDSIPFTLWLATKELAICKSLLEKRVGLPK